MKAGYRHLSYLVLTTALIAPVALGTQAAAQDDKRQDDSQHNDKKQARVYDRTHKDYHNWNDSEDRSYRVPRAKPRRLSRLLEVESYPAGPILELAPQSSRLKGGLEWAGSSASGSTRAPEIDICNRSGKLHSIFPRPLNPRRRRLLQ